MVLEIACFNMESARLAAKAGADRIEFCSNYKAGGLTPNFLEVEKLISEIKIPVHVIIRPRGGDFIYSKSELDEMKKQILFCKKMNLQGVVFGCMNLQNEIDKEACNVLIEAAESMSITFHRAIDESENIFKATETLVQLGFHRILTSGGEASAIKGLEALKKMQEEFGKQIIIMPGGGIRSTNAKQILDYTHCKEIHSAAILDGTEIADESELKRLSAVK